MKLRNVSASQHSTHVECRRKWWFQSVAKRRTPPTASQALGTAIHDGAEKRVKEGNLDTVAVHLLPYVKALEPYFPAPGEPALVEINSSIPTVIGVPWIVRIDLVRPHHLPPLVIDYKSTSDMRYAKTPADLAGDPDRPEEAPPDMQLHSYAEWAFINGYADDYVRVGLIYVKTQIPKTKLPQTKPVYLDRSRADVTRAWESAKPRLVQMAEDSEVTDFNKLPPNTKSCGNYGGCPFRNDCGIMATDVYGGAPQKQAQAASATILKFLNPNANNEPTIPENKNMSYLATLKGNKTNGNGNTHAPQTAPVPTVVTAAPVVAAPATPLSFMAQAQNLAAAQAAVPPVAAPQAAPTVAAQAAVPQVVPDDAPPRDVLATEPEKEKKTRKRRTKEEMAADAEGGEMAPMAQAVPNFAGLVLYVDSYPVKGGGGEMPSLDEWAGPMMMELNQWAETEHNVPDLMLMPFGTQKAALHLAVKKRMENPKCLPPALFVSSNTQLGRDLLPLLSPYATQIIRAIR